MSLTLSLTHDCNLRCAYCYAGRKSRVAMSRQTMRRAVEWAVDYHASQKLGRRFVLGFFGGEPLLEWDLLCEADALAERLCREAGLDLRRTDATWVRPCRRVESRMSKVACLWALALSALLAPLAAWGDIASWPSRWFPPNDYYGFLYRHGYYLGGRSSSGLAMSILYLEVPVAIGIGLLTWVICRYRRKKPNSKRILGMSVSMALCVFLALRVFFLAIPSVNEGFSSMGFTPPSYRLAIWIDTEEHRAEYDHYCIDDYDSNEPYFPHHHTPPAIRPGAPVSVTNAYLRRFGFKLQEYRDVTIDPNKHDAE